MTAGRKSRQLSEAVFVLFQLADAPTTYSLRGQVFPERNQLPNRNGKASLEDWFTSKNSLLLHFLIYCSLVWIFYQVFGIANQKIVDFYINFVILKHCIKVFILIMKICAKLCTETITLVTALFETDTLSTNENVNWINHQKIHSRKALETRGTLSDLGRDKHCCIHSCEGPSFQESRHIQSHP